METREVERLEFQSAPPRRRRQSVSNTGPGIGVEFQSAPPRRRRPLLGLVPRPWALFQSAPPRRRRHRLIVHGRIMDGFNPRLREGGDPA